LLNYSKKIVKKGELIKDEIDRFLGHQINEGKKTLIIVITGGKGKINETCKRVLPSTS
jgi:hypothetical protein